MAVAVAGSGQENWRPPQHAYGYLSRFSDLNGIFVSSGAFGG